jgi:hypothetical protein
VDCDVSQWQDDATSIWNLKCNSWCCNPSKCSLHKLHNVITQFEDLVHVYFIFKTIWWIKFDIANSWQANLVQVHIPSLPHIKFRLFSVSLIMANHTKLLACIDQCGSFESTTFLWTHISVIVNDKTTSNNDSVAVQSYVACKLSYPVSTGTVFVKLVEGVAGTSTSLVDWCHFYFCLINCIIIGICWDDCVNKYKLIKSC